MLAKWYRIGNAPVGSADDSPSGSNGKDARRWSPVLHPFLFGIFPILAVYQHNVRELPASVLTVPLGLTLAITTLAWAVLWASVRDALRAGMVVSLLEILFFGYESLKSAADETWYYLHAFWVRQAVEVHPLLFAMFVGLLIYWGVRAIFRRVRRPELWNSYLNVFSAILVTLPTVGVVFSKFGEPGDLRRERTLPTLGQRGWTPDIYFIVLDGYARSDVMKDIYGFDNRPFLDRLERRGFSVAGQSTSSYCQTQVSLASTLNLDYLSNLIDPRTRDLLPVAARIRQNVVKDLLRPRGYKSVAFQTGFGPTEDTQADLYLSESPSPSVFNQFLIAMTPLAPLAEMILPEARWTDYYSQTRDRVLYTLDHLPSVARIPGPTFTFAHILSPHPPFVFGEHGEDLSPRINTGRQRMVPKPPPYFSSPDYIREGYRKQATYLTARIEQVIDQILEQSPEPPVIILQSDHGSWLHYHHNDVNATDLRERFGTLNAILIPGRKTIEGFTDDVKSVNTFRIVLNNVFGAKIPLLEARSFFSTLAEPLVFIDVTERLNSEKERNRTFRPPDDYLGILQPF